MGLHHSGDFVPVEQAPDEPAKGFYKDEVDRAPTDSPIENKPLDQTKDPIRTRPKNLVLVLREDNVGDLANSLQMFAPRGSVVTVISKEKPEVWEVANASRVECHKPQQNAMCCDKASEHSGTQSTASVCVFECTTEQKHLSIQRQVWKNNCMSSCIIK